MGLPQYNGQQELTVKTVLFVAAADTTLKLGYAVSYDLDDTNAPVTNTADPKNTRGVRVVKPATANLTAFAGVVAAASAGKVIKSGDSAFIDIVVPRKGDVVKVWTNISCTKNVTLLGITNAGGHNSVLHVPPAITTADAASALASFTFNLAAHAVAIETVDRSTTNGTVLAKFL